jgi:hypothetical protein
MKLVFKTRATNIEIIVMFGQVKQIAQIHHIHLVKLIGYYEDNYQQLLVYEYLSNGNIGNHLYGTFS